MLVVVFGADHGLIQPSGMIHPSDDKDDDDVDENADNDDEAGVDTATAMTTTMQTFYPATIS